MLTVSKRLQLKTTINNMNLQYPYDVLWAEIKDIKEEKEEKEDITVKDDIELDLNFIEKGKLEKEKKEKWKNLLNE